MFSATLVAMLGGAILLHLCSRLGKPGRAVTHALARAPGLDLAITWFTVLPWLLGALLLGWVGLAAGIAGQVVSVLLWSWGHELAHRKSAKGPRIVKVLNRLVGRPRNHIAVWITALAVPIFWIVRLGEWIIYPPLIVLVRFPRYRQRDWVNISRHKFAGLVGHDLIWCLYCDWMTGVWSLGTEMLRNVESFWCPIRFSSEAKCENCAHEFPDIWKGWVPADGSMDEVAAVLEEKYRPHAPPEQQQPSNSWFGHPTRAQLTLEGQTLTREDQQTRPPNS